MERSLFGGGDTFHVNFKNANPFIPPFAIPSTSYIRKLFALWRMAKHHIKHLPERGIYVSSTIHYLCRLRFGGKKIVRDGSFSISPNSSTRSSFSHFNFQKRSPISGDFRITSKPFAKLRLLAAKFLVPTAKDMGLVNG